MAGARRRTTRPATSTTTDGSTTTGSPDSPSSSGPSRPRSATRPRPTSRPRSTSRPPSTSRPRRPRRLAILLPPSEGKAPFGDGPPWDPSSGPFGATLAARRRAVADALAEAGGGDARLLGVHGPELDRARHANSTVVGAPTLPAWRRFTGVVWDHLDVASLDRGARTRARSSVLVVNALTGVSALTDPLPDFRLKLSVRLGAVGRLDRWWRDDLSAALNARLHGRLVIDLLPREHAGAWVPAPDRYDLRRVRLVDPAGRVAGHTGKAAKGRLARALLVAGPDGVDDVLACFVHDNVRAELTDPEVSA